MKKYILHIVNSNVYSGLENVACDIIQNTNDFCEQIYVTKNGPIVDMLKEKNIKYEIINNMSIKEVRRVTKKYNAILIHAHDFTASCIAAMSFLKIPIISHLHHNAPWLKKINLKTILYLLCSIRINKIFTVSDSIEKEYVFSKFLKNKFNCVKNPISVSKIRKQVDEIAYQKKYDICCVGRFTEAKNPIRWLRIIKKITDKYPHIKCIWVGSGELRDEFVEKINTFNLNDNVEIIDFQKNPYNFIASSKIYLQTSSWEGFGLTSFEAISLGIPAIVSNVGGLSIIINNECGLLCNDDDDFVNEIFKMIEDNDYYLKKSKSALSHAYEIDNSKSYYKKIKENYNFFIEE